MSAVAERFWAKVYLPPCEDDCWTWTAYVGGRGYGLFQVSSHKGAAHRWAYEDAHGMIPEGLEVDHLCRNRRCVNPAHLEPVTNRINVLRGIGPTALNARKTHCPQGHPYSGENLKIRPAGERQCRICKRATDEKRRRAQLQARREQVR